MSLFSWSIHKCPASVSELVKSFNLQSPGAQVCCMLERDQDATMFPGALLFHWSKSGNTDKKEVSGLSTH